MGVDELVAEARAALAAGRWDDARVTFEAVLEDGDSPEALDGLAEVRFWQGDYAAAIDLRERAYAGFRARGETRYPARLAAYHLAFDYAAAHGNLAAANGWLERGRRLAAVSGDCPERGWVELACVLATEDVAAKERHIEAALDIARRFGDLDLEFDALAYQGVALLEQGQVHEGMCRLDEAAAAAQGGEVGSHTVAGEIYCKMLLACEMALDVRRAEQWTAIANGLTGRWNAAWASAICRMYYGGLLTVAGRWAEAEAELTASIRLYDGSYAALRSGAVVRLADLRVRQGRLEEAEQLLHGYEDDNFATRPVARLHLARREAEVAVSVLRRHLDQHGDSVSQAPVLALLVEAEMADARLEEARAVCSRLTALADGAGVPVMRALADFAAGTVHARARDSDAVARLEAALTGFGAAGLPFEEARARVEFARLVAATKPQVALAEAKRALDIFDRLGATPDADATAALLRLLGARGRTGPKHAGVLSKREHEVLQLLGLGMSNPEIAARLYISRKTASHHVSNVLAKLGLRNRAEAAVFALQQSRGSAMSNRGSRGAGDAHPTL